MPPSGLDHGIHGWDGIYHHPILPDRSRRAGWLLGGGDLGAPNARLQNARYFNSDSGEEGARAP